MSQLNATLLSDINGSTDVQTSAEKKGPSKHARLTSLDIVRGYTIAMMIFVDDVGDAYPHVNHSPWNDITLADHVMPWFLFMVGTSMAFSFRKFKVNRETRIEGTKFALKRAVKLYLLGVMLQGGSWFGGVRFYGKASHRDGPSWDLSTIRYCGILNRIGFAYAVVAMFELWLPEQTQCARKMSSPHLKMFANTGYKWLGAFVFMAIYLLMVLFTWVPTWKSYYRWDHAPNGSNPCEASQVYVPEGFDIVCDNYGYETIIGVKDGTPECSAIGVYDRLFFTQQHLGTWMSTRSEHCSSQSPARCPKLGAPAWCGAMIYDPEGFLATINTIMSCWIGLYFGLVVKNSELSSPKARLTHWLSFAGLLMFVGLIMHFTTFMPMNKQEWSVSYVFFMAGSCGAALAVVYYLVDVKNGLQQYCASFFRPFQYMGMNAILVFFYHGTAEYILNSVYVTPGKNQVNPDPPLEEHSILTFLHDTICGGIVGGEKKPEAQLLYVLFKISGFLGLAWYLYKIKYFWKV
eukprot:g2152.t1